MGRYEEAIASYDQALEFKPNLHQAWYLKAYIYALEKNISLAIENLKQAIHLNREYVDMAKSESVFDDICRNPRFLELIE